MKNLTGDDEATQRLAISKAAAVPLLKERREEKPRNQGVLLVKVGFNSCKN